LCTPLKYLEAVQELTTDGQALLYLLNHNAGAVEVKLPQGRFSDSMNGEALQGQAALAAYGVRILTDSVRHYTGQDQVE